MSKALDELKQYPNWVLWREIPRENKKPAKLIINPKTGLAGSHSDPSTWGTYEDAKRAWIGNYFPCKGFGFVFSEDTPFVGIDLDNCVDETGTMTPFAKRQIEEFNSYTELSPTGTGVHIIAKSSYNFSPVTSQRIEIYSKERYFTITGNRIGQCDELRNIDHILKYRVVPDREDTIYQYDLDDIEDMLSYIPGEGLDYGSEWLRILMAIHSEYPGQDGLDLAENWTDRFSQQNEVKSKWKSFHGSGVTLGTLIHFARQYGWKPTEKKIDAALELVKPALTQDQRLQAIYHTKNVIAELAEEKAWIKFNRYLQENHIDIGLPDPIVNHFQIGARRKKVDMETGEVTPFAITVPYTTLDGDVTGIEFREEERKYSYDGKPSLYYVTPMFDEENLYSIIVPDSMMAIDLYLSGTGHSTIFGLPHTDDISAFVLPDQERFCIIDDTVLSEHLDELDTMNVRFVKVPSVRQLLKKLNRQQVEQVAYRGKPLKDVI